MMADLGQMLRGIRAGAEGGKTAVNTFAATLIDPGSDIRGAVEANAWIYHVTLFYLHRCWQCHTSPNLEGLEALLFGQKETCKAMLDFTAPDYPDIAEGIRAMGLMMKKTSARTWAGFSFTLHTILKNKKEAA